jgi:delta24(24(1))-sterol reductase
VTIDKKEDAEETDVAPAADGARLRRSVRAARVAGDAAEPAQLKAIAADETAAKEPATAHTPEPYQFGGPIGAFGIFVASHFLVLYFFACIHHNNGALLVPRSFSVEATAVWAKQFWSILATHAAPTWWAVKVFWIFQIVQALFAVVLPGVIAKGLPIPSEGGIRLSYLCNAVMTWWITLPIIYALNHYNIFRLSSLIDNIGPLTTVAMFSSDLIAVAVHAAAFIQGKAAEDRSRNWFYDFFMGVWLNPRIGSLDLKMWAEVRVSWIMLFLITAAAATKQFELYGRIGPGMALILTAHFLYTNAIMKGEDCIPTTWDIFHEKWGWMLIFWNLCGVPFVYTSQSKFLAIHPVDFVQYPTPVWVALFVALFASYYCWDTANSQKNRFRMVLQGTYVERPFAFPQLPWGTVYNPKHIVTKAGTPLFVDGWYAYARKFHYTTDVIMATIWALSCGYSHFIPFFYVVFFFGFLSHRAKRDEIRCSAKYGADWQEYLKRVPYRFIPGVY